MGKKAQNMPHPHKRISQNMPGQISKEEGESGNYIFFELEDRIRIAMGIIFGPGGGRGGESDKVDHSGQMSIHIPLTMRRVPVAR